MREHTSTGTHIHTHSKAGSSVISMWNEQRDGPVIGGHQTSCYTIRPFSLSLSLSFYLSLSPSRPPFLLFFSSLFLLLAFLLSVFLSISSRTRTVFFMRFTQFWKVFFWAFFCGRFLPPLFTDFVFKWSSSVPPWCLFWFSGFPVPHFLFLFHLFIERPAPGSHPSSLDVG